MVAVQDEAFDSVRESIVRRPETDIEAILNEIREREMTLTIKESATSLSGDGVSGNRYSRRVQSTSSSGDSGSRPATKTGTSGSGEGKDREVPRNGQFRSTLRLGGQALVPQSLRP